MFRIPADQALINRMGFNNPGAAVLAQRLQQWRARGAWPEHPVGINLGKSKITPLDEAADDYARSFQLLRHAADFFVVNVSSPNTPNLRQLQDRAALETILRRLQDLNRAEASTPRDTTSNSSAVSGSKPILVKVAPDLTDHALSEILEVAQACGLAGIVAANTTLARPEAPSEATRAVYAETGGLSGRPLRARSTAVIRHLYRESRGQIPIVGVGGIFSVEDAWEKIVAGATLVQVYTGFVYRGPSLARELVTGLEQKLRERGFTSLLAAVGTEG
jgi:dihydroorotate dehydrogenase